MVDKPAPKPSDMPGATEARRSGQENDEVEGTETPVTPEESEGSSARPEDPTAELERLRNNLKEARRWERIAKQNKDDALLWRENQEKVQKWDELEAKNRTELENAQQRIAELEAAQQASVHNDLRRKVADELAVPVRFVVGSTEDDMREAAEAYKAERQSDLEAELRRMGVNPAAPASSVNGDGNPTKVPQLDRASLQGMTPKQINDAYAKGQFADALGTRK